jgi:hypothetical protein
VPELRGLVELGEEPIREAADLYVVVIERTLRDGPYRLRGRRRPKCDTPLCRSWRLPAYPANAREPPPYPGGGPYRTT